MTLLEYVIVPVRGIRASQGSLSLVITVYGKFTLGVTIVRVNLFVVSFGLQAVYVLSRVF